MTRRFVTAGVLAALLSPARAQAEPLERGSLRLEWSAPGGCPNGVEVLERIEALLGMPMTELRPEPIVAKGRVAAVEALRFELELETYQRDQRFARAMQAPSCTELTDAGALVLALALDPTLAERQARAAEEKAPETSALPPDPPALPPPPPVPAPPKRSPARTPEALPPRDEPASEEATRPSSTPEWFARAGLLADLGTVSDGSFGPYLAAAAGFGAFRAELGLTWLPPARSYIAEDPARGGDIDLIAVDLAGCFVPLRGTVEVAGCAGAEVGRLHGAGFGTVTESEGSSFWFGAGASALGRLEATEALDLVASAGFLVVPQDTEFTLENVGVVHQVPRAVGRFGLGVETEFP